jgi:hypothetical protein
MNFLKLIANLFLKFCFILKNNKLYYFYFGYNIFKEIIITILNNLTIKISQKLIVKESDIFIIK